MFLFLILFCAEDKLKQPAVFVTYAVTCSVETKKGRTQYVLWDYVMWQNYIILQWFMAKSAHMDQYCTVLK